MLWLGRDPSGFILSSPEAICRESDKESLLDPGPASMEFSEDNVRIGGATEVPNRR